MSKFCVECRDPIYEPVLGEHEGEVCECCAIEEQDEMKALKQAAYADGWEAGRVASLRRSIGDKCKVPGCAGLCHLCCPWERKNDDEGAATECQVFGCPCEHGEPCVMEVGYPS